MEPLGFIPFWTQFDQHRVFGDFAALNPGYDDRALKRGNDVVPVVAREEGAEFARQLEMVAKRKPAYALIYSWNEYFERTQIEPTQSEGARYLNLLRGFRGLPPIETISFSEQLRAAFAKPSAPQAYARAVEVRELTLSTDAFRIKARVENLGPNDWGPDDDVLLGYRVYSEQDEVVAEGRFAALPGLRSGESSESEAESVLETPWPNAASVCYVDLVAEHRFWFWQRQFPAAPHPDLLFDVARCEPRRGRGGDCSELWYDQVRQQLRLVSAEGDLAARRCAPRGFERLGAAPSFTH